MSNKRSTTFLLNPHRTALTPLAWAALLALTGAGRLAYAQAAPAAPAPAASAPEQLETVVVTAGKRAQKQDEVAGSVTVLQGSDLEERGAQDQEDLFKLTPGVQFDKGDPGRGLPSIRGISMNTSSNNLGLQQATTGIYIEDVPFTDPFGFVATADIAPFDLERVEILRGPQGALYGSSSLGGAVRYLFNRPDLHDTEFSWLADANTVAGGGPGYSLNAMANLPLDNGAAGLRIVAQDRQDGGYIHNLGTGRYEANELHQRGARVMGTWKLSPAVTVTGTLMNQRTHIDDGFAVSPDPSQLEIDTPSAQPRTTEINFANLQVDVDLGGQTFTSNTGHFEKSVSQQTDYTRLYSAFLPAPLIYAPSTVNAQSSSQEFRLASNGDTALSYVAGVFYQRSTYGAQESTYAPDVGLPGNLFAEQTVNGVSTEKAAFADAEYRFSKDWSVDLGGRYYRTSLDYSGQVEFVGSPSTIAPPSLGQHGLTPKLSLKYHFGDQLWYALVSQGYRFGGVNVNAPVYSVYKSDSLWNYETGLRLAPSRTLRLDLSAYVLDWKNAQVSAITGGAVPVNGVANVGAATVQGLEMNLKWRASAQLDLSAAAAFTKARTSQDYTDSAGVLVPSGSRLPGTPPAQTSTQLNYRFGGPFQTNGRFNLTDTFLGNRIFNIEGSDRAGGYNLLDSRVAFSKDRWELSLYVNNLANKRGITGVNQYAIANYADYYLVKPRTVGVSLRFDM